MKRSKSLMLSDVLLWSEFVFIPTSDNIFTFKQENEIHYIYVKDKGDEAYDN